MEAMRALALLMVLGGVASAAGPSLYAQGEEKLRIANRERDPGRRAALQAQVLELAEKARALDPADPEAHLLAARAWALVDPLQPEACKAGTCEKAAAELALAQKLDVHGIAAEKIASELGIVLSRMGRWEEALAEYERALRRVDPERPLVAGLWEDASGRSILYSNSAETLMALGRIEQAIVRYRQARDTAEGGKLEWQLANWGLGVALDRDEQEDAARQAIARALERDPTMGQLSSDGVFFEPPGDKQYYLALGHEVAGDHAEAMAAWKAYLAHPDARWARRARQHLAALERDKRPPPAFAQVAFAEPESFIGLRTVSELRKTLSEHEDDVLLCYRRALRIQPRLRGELFLALDVWASGAVWPPHVFQSRFDGLSESAPVATELRRCVELAAQSWRFSSVDRIGGTANDRTENVLVRIQLGPLR
jgi:tetratricopeptide (TPR) repeat protein